MLLDWLAGPVLSQGLDALVIAPGLQTPAPPALYQMSPTPITGVNVQWETSSGNRQVAPVTNPYSASKGIQVQPRQRPQAVAIATRTNFATSMEMLTLLQHEIPLIRDRAKREFMQNLADFKQYVENLKVAALHSMLGYGAVYIDKNGNVLPSATNAEVTVSSNQTYGANAGSPLTKTSYWPGESDIVIGDWSSSSTNIPASLQAMDYGYVRTSNYKPKHILYGPAVAQYMYNNTQMSTFWSRQPEVNADFLRQNLIPQGMLGYQWWPMQDAYFVDQNGTIQPFLAANQIVILPEINNSWYEYFECSLPVPKTMSQPSQTPEEYLNFFQLVKGYSAYLHQFMDPIGMSCVQQWAGLPTPKSQLAIWSATVS